MKAMLLDQYGATSNFRLGEVPVPALRPGHVLIKVAATSVNPADTKLRRNGPPIAPELPGIFGFDVAGTVEAVGEGVGGFAVGDAVYGCAGGLKGLPGADAEYMLADVRLIAPAPKGLDVREAAALPLVTITAWEGLIDRARLQPGQSVLIHGGAGGVGHVAIQIAKAHGAVVTATVSSEEKAALARSLGADNIVFYRQEPVADYVQRLTGGRGFDVVFDATGGDQLVTSFEGAAVSGTVVTIVSQYAADLTLMHTKGLTLHVVFMLIQMIHDKNRERHGAILREAAALVEAGTLRPLLDPNRFTLAEVGAAHDHLESGKAIGKIVIDVAV